MNVTILVGLAQAIGAIAMRVGIRAVIGVDPVVLSWRTSDAQQRVASIVLTTALSWCEARLTRSTIAYSQWG